MVQIGLPVMSDTCFDDSGSKLPLQNCLFQLLCSLHIQYHFLYTYRSIDYNNHLLLLYYSVCKVTTVVTYM